MRNTLSGANAAVGAMPVAALELQKLQDHALLIEKMAGDMNGRLHNVVDRLFGDTPREVPFDDEKIRRMGALGDLEEALQRIRDLLTAMRDAVEQVERL